VGNAGNHSPGMTGLQEPGALLSRRDSTSNKNQQDTPP